jgi:hypothetical protein
MIACWMINPKLSPGWMKGMNARGVRVNGSVTEIAESFLFQLMPCVFYAKDLGLITEAGDPHRRMTAIMFIQADEDRSQALDHNRIIQITSIIGWHTRSVG